MLAVVVKANLKIIGSNFDARISSCYENVFLPFYKIMFRRVKYTMKIKTKHSKTHCLGVET